MNVRDRIAPSPTGENLHIGNVYTALLNYAFAKKHHGQFIVRIEDTDQVRLVPGSESRILDSLRWLNLVYDEGPDIGGPYGPYKQSERKDMYLTYAEELVQKGHAYYCFCTAERLEEMRKKQQEAKQQVLYDGFCKKYSLEEAREKIKTESYVIRLKVPEEGVTEFEDVIRGKISFENKLIDDQVILKSDGFPTYHLGVVVDDHLMEITHIIRAEEWISSAPKHILLYKFFGWELPVFAHTPILRNPDRSKLSKRKNPVWVSWYRQEGFLPDAILNYLALMGWSDPEGKEIFSLTEFIEKFDLKDVKPVGPVFDLEKLRWMNGEYLRRLSLEDLSEKIRDFYQDDEEMMHFMQENSAIIDALTALAQTRMKTLKDFKELVLFTSPQLTDEEKNVKEIVLKAFDNLDAWDKDTILVTMKEVITSEKIKGSLLYKIFTGREKGLPLPEALELFGKDQTMQRLQTNEN